MKNERRRWEKEKKSASLIKPEPRKRGKLVAQSNLLGPTKTKRKKEKKKRKEEGRGARPNWAQNSEQEIRKRE